MNILFVSEYYPPKIMGGGEINLNLLAQALAKRNVNVSVLTSHHEGLTRYQEVNGVHIYRRLKTGDNPNSILSNLKRSTTFPHSVAREVRKIAKKKRFDVVHFIGTSILAAPKLNIPLPFFATIESYPTLCPKGDRTYFGKTECKIKCSLTKFIACQGNSKQIGKMKNKLYLKYNPIFLLYVYNYYKKLNNSLHYCKLIAISEYVQKVLLQHGHQSEVIPNALDTKVFKSTQKQSGKVNVLYLGSLIRSKGPQVLLQALRGLDCHCDLYGEGVLKDELQQLIRKHNLDATIHHPVPYDQIPSIYSNAHIVVFPSIWPEPFGRIAIEAMAAGKPVIGSSIGGIKETIEQGVGILVQPGSVPQLHKALQQLISKPDRRKSLGLEGKTAAEAYQQEGVLDRLMEVYTRPH